MTNTVGETIYHQLGGNKCMVMVGGHNLAVDDKTFMFAFKGSKKFNKCVITLNSMDTYDVRFIKMVKSTCEIKKDITYNGIYADRLDDLFEKQTGLYTHL